jgi:hypothetical protein
MSRSGVKMKRTRREQVLSAYHSVATMSEHPGMFVPTATRLLKRKARIKKTRPPNEAASLDAVVVSLGAERLTEPGPLGIGYFSTSTTYRRTVLYALSRWGARSVQAFDL